MSSRNTELLINLIKPNGCLYDTTHDDYKNIQLKESIWLDIASRCNKDVDTVKADWKKIRDCHRDAIKRRRMLSHIKDVKDIKKWKYEDHMSFLLSHMTNRRREPYFEQSDTNAAPSVQNEEYTISEPVISETFSLVDDEFAFARHKPTTNHISISNTTKTTNDRKNEDRVSKHENTNTKSSEAMDLFFDAMCATTKKLPVRYQMQIKKEIFEVVTRHEEAAFECDDSTL